MTENEKIAQIKWLMEKHPVISKDKDFIEPLKDTIQALEEIQQYRAIGTVEEFKILKEKAEPKKSIRCKSGFKCPTCGYDGLVCFASDGNDKYCSECGQAVYF